MISDDAIVISAAIIIAILMDFVFLKYHFNKMLDKMDHLLDNWWKGE
jgi:hypothetical protein